VPWNDASRAKGLATRQANAKARVRTPHVRLKVDEQLTWRIRELAAARHMTVSGYLQYLIGKPEDGSKTT
jgi:hypothetical protein